MKHERSPESGGLISFVYDRAKRRRTAVFSGVVGDAELLAAYSGLLAQSDYDYAADDLVDLRAVTHLGVTPAGLGELMTMFAPIDGMNVRTRLALVAPADDVFGVSRMYQMLRGDATPEEIAVFREMPKAIAWLDTGPVL